MRYAIYKRLASQRRKKAQQEFWHRWRATSADAYHDDDEPLHADLARIHRGWGY